MNVTTCHHCRSRVVPTPDGRCPACQRPIFHTLEQWSATDGIHSRPELQRESPIPQQSPARPIKFVEAAPENRDGFWWLLFSFEGRIPRWKYWLAFLGIAVVVVLILVATGILFGRNVPFAEGYIFSFCLIYFWMYLAISVKRWHDRDKTGWWVLIRMVPFVGPLWEFIELGCLRGTLGDNHFGADPAEQE